MLLVAAAFATAALSAVFGMAGGLLMMGACALVLPVAPAMVLHGVTQATSNGFRALLLREHVQIGVLAPYAAGALAAAALLWPVRFVPDPALVFAGLGLVPFLSMALPARPWMDVRRPVVAAFAGALVAALQLVAGVAGPVLDVFFVHTDLGRREVVATKAATQVLAHGLKIAWFASVDWPDPSLAAAAALAAIAGTSLGARLLERMPDTTWRKATRLLLAGIGVAYLGLAWVR